MKNLVIILFLFLLTFSCKKTEETAGPVVDPNKIAATDVRITAAMPTTIKEGDTFVLAGSFAADAWTPDKSTFELKKQKDGTWRVDVPVAKFDKKLDYKVVRNAKNGSDPWKFVEKDGACAELADNRKIDGVADIGKELKIKIDNFRNTGTCPD